MSARALEQTRDVARQLNDVIADVGARLAAGMSTRDVDRMIVDGLARHELEPAMRGFNGFPSTSAISIDEQVLHVPPSDRRIAAGNLVTIQSIARRDLGIASLGWTFAVGSVGDEKARLLSTSIDALAAAKASIRPNARTGDVGAAIQRRVEASGFSVIRDFVGYAIGQTAIEPPQLPCYGVPRRGQLLKRGMVLHVHVISAAGDWRIELGRDDWSVTTCDLRPSALVTAMVLVAGDHAEALTSLGAIGSA
ncbi:MAG: M24 family metallopeptidase [Sandaracinaceae bacterium]|nr:M24 family metallopeptidase [Sandaracinaceae bacterium]